MTTVIPGIFKELIRKGRLGWVNEPGSGHAVLVERDTGCVGRLLDSIAAPRDNGTPPAVYDRVEPLLDLIETLDFEVSRPPDGKLFGLYGWRGNRARQSGDK